MGWIKSVWSWLKGKKTKIGAVMILAAKTAEKVADFVGPIIGVDPDAIKGVAQGVEQAGVAVTGLGIADAAKDAALSGRE